MKIRLLVDRVLNKSFLLSTFITIIIGCIFKQGIFFFYSLDLLSNILQPMSILYYSFLVFTRKILNVALDIYFENNTQRSFDYENGYVLRKGSDKIIRPFTNLFMESSENNLNNSPESNLPDPSDLDLESSATLTVSKTINPENIKPETNEVENTTSESYISPEEIENILNRDSRSLKHETREKVIQELRKSIDIKVNRVGEVIHAEVHLERLLQDTKDETGVEQGYITGATRKGDKVLIGNRFYECEKIKEFLYGTYTKPLWGNPLEGPIGGSMGPLQVNDPKSQLSGCNREDSNQPLASNMAKALLHQKYKYEKTNFSNKCFTDEQKEFLASVIRDNGLGKPLEKDGKYRLYLLSNTRTLRYNLHNAK